ncbi:MAG: thioredoxin-like domain-containing protein, partial [Bacteroidota bacterium]
GSYTLKDFRGKFVLLDFWTFGCINCQHILPDLKQLEEEYAEELIVVGVHSAKFKREKLNKTIRKAILKFGITHPVVNDADFKVWENYAVKAWPTVVLIDPEGKIVSRKAGEGVYKAVKPYMEELTVEFKGRIDRTPIRFQLEKQKETKEFLRFPSKLIKDDNGYIYLSDSGHNRILKLNEVGEVVEVIGAGEEGDQDGSFAKATFYEPHGLALKGDLLYIADTKNNKIRLANLITKEVTTIAGDGKLSYYSGDKHWNTPVNPNSPWDLLIEGDQMYIANAGNHQILRMDLNTNKAYRFAGSGREALQDGTLREAAFNQPSGLAKKASTLYVADPEASAIRAIALDKKQVNTLVGKGLFSFGDQDGKVESVLLQHAVGIQEQDNILYIADTYNGKIKKLDLEQKRVSTLIAGLDEPNDVLFTGNTLWISDTNNHQIVQVDLDTNEKTVLMIGE